MITISILTIAAFCLNFLILDFHIAVVNSLSLGIFSLFTINQIRNYKRKSNIRRLFRMTLNHHARNDKEDLTEYLLLMNDIDRYVKDYDYLYHTSLGFRLVALTERFVDLNKLYEFRQMNQRQKDEIIAARNYILDTIDKPGYFRVHFIGDALSDF